MSSSVDVRPLIAVVGATASGKSARALRLAQRFDGEIVSADSRAVYRGMDIGTAKPTPEERRLVRHWLVDVVDPDGEFSLGAYLDSAQQALADIWSRGKAAFLVGGTGQYVWGLLEGWQVPRVPPDQELRRLLEERAQREGGEALYAELQSIDPEAAARIDPRNVRRVMRALEIEHASVNAGASGGTPAARWRKLQPTFTPLILAIEWPRAELYRRIDERADGMIEAGLVEEVRALLDKGYDAKLPSMSGSGYREIAAHLRGEMSPAEAVAKMKTETHRVARMQRTWFRRDDPRIHWLDAHGDIDAEASRLVADYINIAASPG